MSTYQKLQTDPNDPNFPPPAAADVEPPESLFLCGIDSGNMLRRSTMLQLHDARAVSAKIHSHGHGWLRPPRSPVAPLRRDVWDKVAGSYIRS